MKRRKSLVVVCMLNASLAVGPLASLAMTPRADAGPVVVFRCAGLEKSMPSPKDAGLKRAITMLSARLPEIPREIARFAEGDDDAQQAMKVLETFMPMFAAFATQPCEFAILDNGINDLGVNDLDVRLVVETGKTASAQQMADAFTGALRMADPNMMLKASESNPLLLEFGTPIGTLLWGPANASGRFVVGVDFGGDGLRTDPVALPAMAQLGGAAPVWNLSIDCTAAVKVAEQFVAMSGQPEIIEGFRNMTASMPEGGLSVEGAGGFSDGWKVQAVRFKGFAAMIPGGAAATPTIKPGALKIIPSDARTFSFAHEDIDAMLDGMMSSPAGVQIEQGMQEAVKVLGFHPINDFARHFGPVWAAYSSDGTGGGGLTSLVLINGGVNSEGMSATLERLATMANAQAQQIGGYVRISKWSMEAARVGAGAPVSAMSLTFPGLPVPLELSLALADDHLVAAFSPQALQVAVAQVRSGKDSIEKNPRFASVSKGRLENATHVKFVDSERSIDRGYPTMQVLGSMLANFVRSPSDASRDPGFVTPTFAELSKDVKPILSVTWVEGNDYIEVTRSDASAMVDGAAMSGAAGIVPLIAMAAVAAALARAAAEHH